jgi:DNA-binding response OmpR family regulator
MFRPQILVIEDTESVREVLIRQLEALECEVTGLADGNLVKQELKKKRYDLVLADLNLPDCSGIDIARFSHAQNCPIVLLSGDEDVASRPTILSAGFNKILLKPIGLNELDALLHEFFPKRNKVVSKTPIHIEDTANGFDSSGTINLVSLAEQMGDLDDVAYQMLSRFPDMMRPLVSQLQESIEKSDYSRIADIAHSLKGAARSAGADRLSAICEDLQTKAEKNIAAENSIETLLHEFSRVEQAIQGLNK